MEEMPYRVTIKTKIVKKLYRLPQTVQKKLQLLLNDLRQFGPVQPGWPNYSKLGGNKYHCHLGYSWVACWQKEDESITIEVYYVGSRENAPY
jgi:mRNA-degrading endonuclease RelE of RelBE toxin-antitoxin system